MKMIASILRRDLRLGLTRGADVVMTVFFFFVVATLFPFALNDNADLLRQAAAGVLWVAALLAALLSLDHIYHRDFDDGTLDLLVMETVPPIKIVAAKMLSHFMLTGLPLIAASVVAAPMLNITLAILPALLLSLGLGVIYMSLLGGFGACLTFGSRKPSLLMVLIVLPLFIPMLVLGLLAAEAGLAELPMRPYLLLQAALLVAALPLLPLFSASLLSFQVRSS